MLTKQHAFAEWAYKFDSYMCQNSNVLNAYYYKNLRHALNTLPFL